MRLTILGVIENGMRTMRTFVLHSFILSTFYLLTACVSMIKEYYNKTNHQGIDGVVPGPVRPKVAYP